MHATRLSSTKLMIIVITSKETALPSSVNLGDKLEGVVDRLISDGRFGSRSEVLREGVRLVQERESWIEMVERKVAEGRAQLAAGQGIPIDEAFDRLAARYAER